MKSFNAFINEGKTTFKHGQKVTIKNARKYDSMGPSEVDGVVDFVWPDGRVSVSVRGHGGSTGQINANPKDVVLNESNNDIKSVNNMIQEIKVLAGRMKTLPVDANDYQKNEMFKELTKIKNAVDSAIKNLK